MWHQSVIVLAVSCVVLSRPIPKPTPISVYQQDDGGEQQDYQQQYRPQQIPYKQVIQQVRPQQTRALLRPQQQAQDPRLLQQTESEDYEMGPPQPYQFSFDVNDDENTNYQNRKEQREGNKISGSYSVVDSDGFIRTVTYTADPVEGFKAHVSREPTNIVVKIPTPAPNEPSQQSIYTPQPKLQYSPSQSTKQIGIQYNGAPVPRQQPIRQPTPVIATVTPRRQQTQQYLQSTQQDLSQYQPIYQGQGTVRHSQAISTAGQINQFLAETSPQAAQINQFSNSNTNLRG